MVSFSLPSFLYLPSVTLFPFLCFSFLFSFYLSFSFCRICFSTRKKMQNLRVSHLLLLLHYSKHVLDQLTATEFSQGEKSEAADMTKGISAVWLQTPNTMTYDVQRSCHCEKRLHGPTAPCKCTVPADNTTENPTSRHTTIRTHILLAMLEAARSKECPVYCFMGEGSCVRIPLGKWLYICFFVRSCCPGHKLIHLSELQQFQ